MDNLSSFANLPAAAQETSQQRLALSLLRASGGDQAYADMLRSMVWSAYGDAGYPFGLSEAGMSVWWEHQQHTRRQ